jgi:hypothetical protein
MNEFRPSALLQGILASLDRVVAGPMPDVRSDGQVINRPSPLPPLPAEPSDPLERAFYRDAIMPMYQRVTALLQASSPQRPAASGPIVYDVGSGGGGP